MTQPQQALGSRLDAAITAAVTQTMNTIPDAGAPLHWNLGNPVGSTAITGIKGLAGSDYRDEEIPAVLAGWARLLGLSPVSEPMTGATEYAGTVDGCPVLVWGITDRAVWDAWFARTDRDSGGGPR
jgi:hypothetical protein